MTPREELEFAVLDLVDQIPSGRIMTFGMIADLVGRGGPRGVGNVMLRRGYEVPWWRVVRANGSLPVHLMIEAQQHWLAEGTPIRRGLVDTRHAHWLPEDDAAE